MKSHLVYSSTLCLVFIQSKLIFLGSKRPLNLFFTMVLILDGNLEIGAHVRSNLCYLNFLRHLLRVIAVTNIILFTKNTYFPSCVRNMFCLPSNSDTMYFTQWPTIQYSTEKVQIIIFNLWLIFYYCGFQM